MTKNRTRFFIFFILWIIVWPGAAVADSDFTGTWVLRQQKVGDALTTPTPTKTIILTPTHFHALMLEPEICAASGPLMVIGEQMKVHVEHSTCPPPETPDDNLLYTYDVDTGGGKLTLMLARQDQSIVEVYTKSPDKADRTCRHPFCGIYNRVATLVDGVPVNSEPAYTVITDSSYYSISRVCFNLCSIGRVDGDQMTMTMQSHNCPVGPVDPQPPGTVITSTWKLSNGGRTLVNNDSRFGAMVTTEFERLN